MSEPTTDTESTMRFLLATLTTPDEARAYLAALIAADCGYHIEDSAADIIRIADGSPLFTPEQAALADLRAAECMALLDDPCGVILGLINPTPEE